MKGVKKMNSFEEEEVKRILSELKDSFKELGSEHKKKEAMISTSEDLMCLFYGEDWRENDK